MEGVGQQLTKKSHFVSTQINPTKTLRTGKRNITFVCSGITPLEDSQALPHREGFRWVFESHDARLARSKLGDIGMLLELQVASAEVRTLSKSDAEVRLLRVVDQEVHVSLEFH